MAHLTFNLTPRKFYEAQRAWREAGRTEAEICTLTTELLSKLAEEKQASKTSGAPNRGNFPKWLREFLKEQISKLQPGAKLSWDCDNDSYSCRLPQDGFEVDEWIAGEFTEAFTKRLDSEEGKLFNSEYQLRPVISDTDGRPEMRELEASMQSAPAEEVTKGAQR